MRGRCHCGAIELDFMPARAPQALTLLACQCSFCRKHGTRATADPDGLLVITVTEREALERYEFGLATAQFLLCRRCGVYLGAVCGERGLVNVNCLDDQARFTQPARPIDYDGETAQARRLRRERGWTPVEWRGA
jgi:hypothetical protein